MDRYQIFVTKGKHGKTYRLGYKGTPLRRATQAEVLDLLEQGRAEFYQPDHEVIGKINSHIRKNLQGGSKE